MKLTGFNDSEIYVLVYAADVAPPDYDRRIEPGSTIVNHLLPTAPMSTNTNKTLPGTRVPQYDEKHNDEGSAALHHLPEARLPTGALTELPRQADVLPDEAPIVQNASRPGGLTRTAGALTAFDVY